MNVVSEHVNQDVGKISNRAKGKELLKDPGLVVNGKKATGKERGFIMELEQESMNI